MEKKHINTFEMSKLDENMEWENETPYLASLSRKNPFGTPANYFEELPANIKAKVFLNESFSAVPNGFAVPINYFEDLNEQIEGKIAAEKLKSLVAKDGFFVPISYFDSLSSSILNKTVAQETKPKVIRLWQINLFKYASTACVVLLLASGLYYKNYSEVNQPILTADLANENMLYDIDESVIREHIQESQTTTNASATDAEIENYILTHLSTTDISNNL